MNPSDTVTKRTRCLNWMVEALWFACDGVCAWYALQEQSTGKREQWRSSTDHNPSYSLLGDRLDPGGLLPQR
jgi:hypothetical protein